MYICIIYIYTSSTAQGGGGSFKNRKLIGELGCCESRMAEQSHWWIERWLMSPLFLSLFLSFSDYLPTYRSIYLSIHPSIYLSVCLSIYLSINQSINQSIYLSNYLSIYLPSIYLSIYQSSIFYLSIYLSLSLPLPLSRSLYLSISLSVCLSIYLSIYLSASLKTKQFCKTSSFFELDNIQNEALLRDFFNFWTWQDQKQSNSARLPSKMEIWVQRLRFAIFPVHLSKVLRLPRKSDARSYEVLHLSRKIILANLQIWCSKMQPLSGNQHPDLLTSLMNMSFVLRLPRDMHLCRSSSNVPRLPSFLETRQNPHVLLTFEKVHNPLRLPRETTSTACTFSTSQLPKVVRTWRVFNILVLKCARHNNGVLFFGISTSKTGPRMVCFVHFDFENVLRATTACTFSTSTSKSAPNVRCF